MKKTTKNSSHLILLIWMSFMSLTHISFAQSDCIPGFSRSEISEGNVVARFMNQGDMFWNPAAGLPGFKWPKNDPGNKHLVFAAANWFGGIDKSDSNRVIISGQTYRANGRFITFWPGPLNADPILQKECEFWDQHFKVTKQEVDQFLALTFPTTSNLVPIEILIWPGKGNPFLKSMAIDSGLQNLSKFDQDLAPFVDVDGNGIYNPLIGDFPDLKNRLSMIWWVFNDKGNGKRFPENSILVPSGNLEFQMLASVYPKSNGQYYLDNSIFLDLKVINKGNRTLDSCQIGFWTDFDIGYGGDDYIECDVQRNLSIGFNADNNDSLGYGINPPAIAFKAIDGPTAYSGDGIDNNRNGIVDEPNEKIFMSSFKYYNGSNNIVDGEPHRFNHFYNYLKGLWLNGSKTTNGQNGTLPVSTTNPATNFMFPGASDPIGYGMGGTPQNPIYKNPWTELSSANAPGDRRTLMAAGPFQLIPGGSFHYTICNLIGFGGNNIENLNTIKLISDSLDNYLPTLTSSSLDQIPNTSDFKVFPNPGKDKIKIVSPASINHWSISDLRGKILLGNDILSNENEIDIANLKNGIYFLTVQASGKMEVKKLIKE